MPPVCRFPHSYPLFDPLAPMLLPDENGEGFYASLAHAYICRLHHRRPALHLWLRYKGHEHPLFYDTQMGIVHALKQVADPTPFSGQEAVTAKERAQAFDWAFDLWASFCSKAYADFSSSRNDAPFSFHKSIPDWMAHRHNAKLSGKAVSTPRHVFGQQGLRSLRRACRLVTQKVDTPRPAL